MKTTVEVWIVEFTEGPAQGLHVFECQEEAEAYALAHGLHLAALWNLMENCWSASPPPTSVTRSPSGPLRHPLSRGGGGHVCPLAAGRVRSEVRRPALAYALLRYADLRSPQIARAERQVPHDPPALLQPREAYALSYKTEAEKQRIDLDAATAYAILKGDRDALESNLPGNAIARLAELCGPAPLLPVARVHAHRYARESGGPRLTLDVGVRSDDGLVMPYGVLEAKDTDETGMLPWFPVSLAAPAGQGVEVPLGHGATRPMTPSRTLFCDVCGRLGPHHSDPLIRADLARAAGWVYALVLTADRPWYRWECTDCRKVYHDFSNGGQ